MGMKYHGPDPTITFARAMRLFLIRAQPDKISTVKSCPALRFSGLVLHEPRTANNPDKVARELEDCDYASLPDRWYALYTLIEYEATPFWASSWVDARVQEEEAVPK